MDLKRWKVFQSLDPLFLSNVKLAYVGRPFGKTYDDYGDPLLDQIEVGFLVMRNDDVFGVTGEEGGFEFLGANVKLGANCFVPVKIAELCGKGIKEFGHTQGLFVALTDGGEVYQWGNGQSKLPTLVGGEIVDHEVHQIATGPHHVLVLTRHEEVYVWPGDRVPVYSASIDGQATRSPVKVTDSSLLSFSEFEWIRSIACTAFASFILSNEGRIWWWETIETGATVGGRVKAREPRQITDLHNVAKIAAGSHELVALTKDNELFMWGLYQSDGQQRRKANVRKLNFTLEQPADIFASGFVFACQTSSKKIYVWGQFHGADVTAPTETYFSSFEEVFTVGTDRPKIPGVIVRQLNGKRVADAWGEAFNDSETADIKFKIEEKFLAGHKLFLKFRCQYFKRMFASEDWKERDGCVEIQSFSYETFRTFLYYLYTDQIDCEYTLGNFQGLLRIADYYGEDDLRERCEDLLKIFMHHTNVCALYSLAHECNSEKLKLYTMEYIIPNFSDVLTTRGFAELRGELKTELLRDMNNRKVFQHSRVKPGN